MAILGFYAGTYTALEILSCSRLEKPTNEDSGHLQFIHRLLDAPIQTSLSLGVGRGLSLALVVVTSLHISLKYLSGQTLAFALSALIIVFSLIVPLLLSRAAAAKAPERYISVSKFVVYSISFLLKPFVAALGNILERVSPRLLESFAFQIIPLMQKIEMMDDGNGFLEKEEREIMSSILDFGDTKVREVMVPRIDIVAVNRHMDQNEALKTIMEAGHSRIPVYDGTIDKIVGMVYTKDLLKRIVSEDDFSLGEISRDVFFVPESKKIDDLLTEFKKRKKHVAIAVDEYGGTAGLVTLEDVLEEIVGDIQDEFDEEEELVKKLDEDTALCNAKVHLDELNEMFGLDLPEGSVDTLGGFLYERIGRVPRVGDVIPHKGVDFEIKSVLRQRIDKVLLKGLKSIRKQLEGGFS